MDDPGSSTFSSMDRSMNERRYRRVHLDFHTSADCENVGADFDPEVFAETVRMGRVNSMTVFAKCHHGFSYYPTEVGTQHPNLAVPDLMGAQIEALHGIGVLARSTLASCGTTWPARRSPAGS
jgi:hypothetical protein